MGYNFFLKEGDSVGIIAPASDFNKESFLQGIDYIKNMGFFPVYNGDLLNPSISSDYLMHDDEFRKNDLESLLSNKKINVILAVRGGYGSIRTLSSLNQRLLLSNKKVIVGFSDITAFHVFLNKHKQITIHGPMLNAFMRNEKSTNHLFNLLTRKEKLLTYELDEHENPDISGILTGGNLAVIASMAGTKFYSNFKNKIVFLEDLNEPAYKIDRMLMQLKLSGFFPKAIILGQFMNCTENIEEIYDIFDDIFYDIPIYTGLNIGHEEETLSIPFGVKVKIRKDKLLIKL